MAIIKKGMRGNDVLVLQEKLVNLGYPLKTDGDFGDATYNAVVDFQKKNQLGVDGVVGNDTIRKIDSKIMASANGPLKESDYLWAAVELNADIAAVKAVREVESPRGGFLPDGRPTILYERHIMARRLELLGINPAPFIKVDPNIVNRSTGGYIGGSAEYNRLQKAKLINPQAAQESCSWGAYQIMGMHWKYLGYTSVDQFVTVMSSSERGQLEVFVNFIKNDKGLLKALRNKDWADFAYRYNGKEYAKNKYDQKLSTAYTKYS